MNELIALIILVAEAGFTRVTIIRFLRDGNFTASTSDAMRVVKNNVKMEDTGRKTDAAELCRLVKDLAPEWDEHAELAEACLEARDIGHAKGKEDGEAAVPVEFINPHPPGSPLAEAYWSAYQNGWADSQLRRKELA